jgi:hypothetical protein
VEDRWLLQEQTGRNVLALEAEGQGRIEEAIALYEINVEEGFPSDLPYGRLVAIYERREDYPAAERVLLRAMEVFQSSTRRPAADRRAFVKTFRQRLTRVRRSAASRTSPPPG